MQFDEEDEYTQNKNESICEIMLFANTYKHVYEKRRKLDDKAEVRIEKPSTNKAVLLPMRFTVKKKYEREEKNTELSIRERSF